MKTGKYTPGIIALLTSAVLVIASSVAISYIYAHEKINITNHVLTRLDSINGLVDLWSNDFRSGARQLAEDPKLTQLIGDYLEGRIDSEHTSEQLSQWFRPIYLSRGYEGHSIITPDNKILFASSPAYVGKYVAAETSRKAIALAFSQGTAIGHISESAYPVRNVDGTDRNDAIFQLGCSRIKYKAKIVAVLCLRQNPNEKLFAMLATGFSGDTGESYAVDKDAKIISPTRFDPIKLTTHPLGAQATLKKDLYARSPKKNYARGYTPGIQNENPITQSVDLAIKQGASGYIDDYPDYRGISVVGAAKWIPELDMAIVIEQDVSEVYGPYQFSRRAIILLTAIAILLINILTLSLIQSRKNLALREERLRAFLDNFPGVAHMRDSDGRFLIANRMAEVANDSPLKKLLGTKGESLPFDAKYLLQMQADHDTVIKSGKTITSIRQSKNIFNLGYEWIKTIRFPVFEAETGKVSAVGTIVQDISEQMRSAQQLEEIRVNLENIVEQRTTQLEVARKEAEQAAQTKANFMANMSHELRTPMNAIIGLSHLAALVSDDPKLRSYLTRIHQSSNHLLSIINDILDFSKIEAGKMTIDQIDFSVSDLLEKVASLISEKAFEKKLELLVDIEQDVPIFLKGDPLRLGQILINFANNAVKFTEHGEVIIRVRKIMDSGNKVYLSFEVQDTGIGISEEGINQLFKPFHQLDTSLTRRFEGTGLGLAISKNLIEQMGGKVVVKSKPDQGSQFSIVLSLQKSSDSTLSLMHSIQIQSLKHLTALVLTSNNSAKDILDRMFTSLEIQVTHSNSVEKTIQTLTNNPAFDIIFIFDTIESSCAEKCALQLRNLFPALQGKIVVAKSNDKHTINPETDYLFDASLLKPVLLPNLIEALTGMHKDVSATADQTDDLSRFSSLQDCNILLVDDNLVNQDVARELLGLLNVNLTLASTGYEALEKLDAQSFDVVLMDVQMPGIDGYETTTRIRAKSELKNLPIIAMTANALTGDREKCLSVGMNDYLSKPIVPQDLFETLLKWYKPASNKTNEKLEIKKNTETFEQELAQLEKIDNLFVDQAIQRLLGNQSFYISLLRKFVAARDSIADDIKSSVQKGDYETASRLAHSFKSLAGTVGATELQTMALQLELELSQSIFNSQLLEDFRDSLKILMNNITTALSYNVDA